MAAKAALYHYFASSSINYESIAGIKQPCEDFYEIQDFAFSQMTAKLNIRDNLRANLT